MRSWNKDPYTQKAKAEHYVARSVYKLEEIHRRTQILEGAQSILDLGAAPGSWVQYCLKTCPEASITAIDLQPLQWNHPNLSFHRQSIEDFSFAPKSFDRVLSDMAPKTTGITPSDIAASVELAELALQTAVKGLMEGGHFVVKIFMGEGYEDFQREFRTHFKKTRVVRPDSTRKQSREVFLVGLGAKTTEPLS